MNYTECGRNEKVRIAFLFQVASFWPSWDSLYSKLIRDDRFEVKLYYLYVPGYNCAQTDTSQAFLRENKLKYEDYTEQSVRTFAPHYMVVQTPYDKGHREVNTWTYRFKLMGIRIIYIPYGIEISDTKESRFKHFSMSVVSNAELIYVMSDAMKKEYEKYCLNAKAVRALGLPRFDCLADKDRFRLTDSLKSRIKQRKTVLWKVHFPKVFEENGCRKQATPKLEEYIRFADYIAQSDDLFFIFMPHPKFTDETIHRELRTKALELTGLLSKMENVYIDRSDDYRCSLVNADAIMTDRSAVMVEAGAMGVPVLYLYNTYYYEPMTPPVKSLLDTYEQGSTAEDMIGFVERFREGRLNRVNFTQNTNGSKDCAGRIIENLLEEVRITAKEVTPDNLGRNDKIIVFGTGAIWEYCKKTIRNLDGLVSLIAFADNSSQKQGTQMDGVKIISPGEIKDMEYDFIVIASDLYHDEIFKQLLREVKVQKNKILSYDQFLVLLS